MSEANTLEPSDAALVADVRNGDTAAFSELYRRHVGRVGRILRRMLGGSSSEIEDAIQMVFLDAAKGLERLPEPEGFQPWLVQITVRRALKVLRSRKRMRWLISTPVLPELSASRDNEAVLLLYGLLERLPPELRSAWTMREIEGWSIDDVASACNTSRSTVKRRIAQAADFLKKGYSRG